MSGARPHPARGAARARGFTLLEVMAAVLVLGMLYTVLAETAIRGLRSEGESRRRTEASLLADRALSELEMQLAVGQIPESGEQEENVDPFRVGIRVAPYDATPLIEAIQKAQEERGVRAPRPGASAPARTPSAAPAGGTPDAAPPIQSLFTPPRAGEEGRLRRIDVWVAWQEGDQEERVTRTTFAFDSSGLEEAFPDRSKQTLEQSLDDMPEDMAIQKMEEIMRQMENQMGSQP